MVSELEKEILVCPRMAFFVVMTITPFAARAP